MEAAVTQNGTPLGQTEKELVALISDFFQIPRTVAQARLKAELAQPGFHVAAAWRLANPVTPNEITRFYEETESYIYDLAGDHCRQRRQVVWDIVLRRIERHARACDVLLYGDGIGTDSIALARRGHNVTYFDLPGVTARFARFRFERECLATCITVVSRPAEIASAAFDAVVCIEVLEHLPDPLAALGTIHRALRYGGIAVVTESFSGIGPEYPSHLPQNARFAGKTHRLMENLGFASTYYNKKPVNYPMEFTKVRTGVAGSLLKGVCRVRRAADTRIRRLLVHCSAWAKRR